MTQWTGHRCFRDQCHTETIDMILHGQEFIMADLTRLDAAVTANTDATDAAVTALGGTSADQAGVDAAANQIEANTAALRAATPTA